MWKLDSHIQTINTEDDIKRIASYSERKDFIRSRFDRDYTGTTQENETLLRNPEFKKSYLEKFFGIKNASRDARMNLIKDRPDRNPQIQQVRESLFSKIGQALGEIFQGLEKPVHSIENRLVAWRNSLKSYGGKLVRQFNSVKLTWYYPPPKWGYSTAKERRMEWGGKDKLWKPLYTLQQYLRWEAPYVSIAGHKSISYGTRVRIAALEAQYGRPIECRVVDTWSAFNKLPPYGKLDVCVQDKQSSHLAIVNTRTPVQQIA